MQETPVRFLGQEDPLEKGQATTPVLLDFPGGIDGKESACNDAEHLFMFQLAVSMSSLKEFLFRSSSHFYLFFFFPWKLSCMCSLCSLCINPLFDILFANNVLVTKCVYIYICVCVCRHKMQVSLSKSGIDFVQFQFKNFVASFFCHQFFSTDFLLNSYVFVYCQEYKVHTS